MNNLNELLHDLGNNGAGRCEIVSQLEDVRDERVVSLFVLILEDFEDDEGVRIEILKSFVMRKDPPDSRIRTARTILNVLQNDGNDLVRQHAANALYLYADVNGVLECLESIVGNMSEDLDVRYNALAAIISNRWLSSCCESLQRLANVPDLGRIAQRALVGV